MLFEANPSNHIQNRIKIVSKSYQNRNKIVTKSYQNRNKIVSKSYQNRIKTLSKPRKSTRKRIFLDCFCFLLLKPTCRNHIKTVSQRCQNHNNRGEIRKKCPWAGSASFCGSQPTHQKPLQNFKTISNSYQNRIQTVTRTISKS